MNRSPLSFYLLAVLLCVLSVWPLLRSDYPWLPEEVARLREALPPNMPVAVLVEATPGCYGSCAKEDVDGDGRADRYLVRITPGNDDQVARDTLYHEWAHTLSWADAEELEEDHCDAWGVAYARVYRAMEAR